MKICGDNANVLSITTLNNKANMKLTWESSK